MTDPTLGVWLHDDGEIAAPDPSNPYRYVGNSPMGYTDPSGLSRRLPRPPDSSICRYLLDGVPPDEYAVFAGGARRGIRLNDYDFTNIRFEWRGVRYRGDVEADTYAERRFKSTVAFGDDRVLTNFATFVRLEYSFTNLRRIEGMREVKVPDFRDGYWLPVRLVGVFIAPTIEDFARDFKPTSFATFEREFINGLNKLPAGHPSDKKKPAAGCPCD